MVNKQLRTLRRAHRNSYNIKRININNSGLMRVLVNRSQKNISAQLIDIVGKTHIIVASNQKAFASKAPKDTKSYNEKGAYLIGQMLGEYMKKHNILQFVFDRSSYQFHGRVKKLCEGIHNIINKEEK